MLALVVEDFLAVVAFFAAGALVVVFLVVLAFFVAGFFSAGAYMV